MQNIKITESLLLFYAYLFLQNPRTALSDRVRLCANTVSLQQFDIRYVLSLL
jgi:hypothetical protein